MKGMGFLVYRNVGERKKKFEEYDFDSELCRGYYDENEERITTPERLGKYWIDDWNKSSHRKGRKFIEVKMFCDMEPLDVVNTLRKADLRMSAIKFLRNEMGVGLKAAVILCQVDGNLTIPKIKKIVKSEKLDEEIIEKVRKMAEAKAKELLDE